MDNKITAASIPQATNNEEPYISNYSEDLYYLDEQTYRDCSRDERCQSCIHWNGFICNAKHAVCDYQAEQL